jgi:hypothetical protein
VAFYDDVDEACIIKQMEATFRESVFTSNGRFVLNGKSDDKWSFVCLLNETDLKTSSVRDMVSKLIEVEQLSQRGIDVRIVSYSKNGLKHNSKFGRSENDKIDYSYKKLYE